MVINIIKGIALGAGAILPGISSGVLCVIFGIYEKIIDSFLNFFSDIKKNLKFLFPLIVGGGIGVIIFSNIIKYLLYSFPIQTKSIFIGLILGSIPELTKEINKKVKFKKKYIGYTIISLLIGIMMVVIENKLSSNIITIEYNFIYLIIAGFLMSIGIVVPGVSSTIILMLLGIYNTYISALSGIDFKILIPLGIGIFIGSIVFMKIIEKLLDKHYGPTFYGIIGFSIGSIFVLFPNITSVTGIIVSILCIIFGIYLCGIFNKE